MKKLYEYPVNQLKYAQCIRLAGPMHHFPHHCHERTSGMSNSYATPKPKRPIHELTQSLLKSLMAYDKDTGVFTWMVNRQGHAKAGSLAGTISTSTGYLDLFIAGRRYGAHRVAWLYEHGKFPEGEIDHINGIRDDNRIENLRDVSTGVNRQNQRKAHKGSRTGVLGVRPNGRGFEASIQTDGKQITLGTYPTIAMAEAAYLAGKRRLHVGCTL